jgi:hypothetical protein
MVCCEDESVSEIQKKSFVSSMMQTSSFGDGVVFSNLSSNTQKTRACKNLLDVQGQHNRKLKKREMKMDLCYL